MFLFFYYFLISRASDLSLFLFSWPLPLPSLSLSIYLSLCTGGRSQKRYVSFSDPKFSFLYSFHYQPIKFLLNWNFHFSLDFEIDALILLVTSLVSLNFDTKLYDWWSFVWLLFAKEVFLVLSRYYNYWSVPAVLLNFEVLQ